MAAISGTVDAGMVLGVWGIGGVYCDEIPY